MKIQIIGPADDPDFRSTVQHFLKAIHRLQIEATIDEVTEINEMQNFPLTSYPAVYINGKLVHQGTVVSENEAQNYLGHQQKWA